MPEWLQVLQGLYKVEMHTVHGSRRGVLYVYDGKMMGGNSAFAFIGTYQESGSGDVSVDISTLRHHDGPKIQPFLKDEERSLTMQGRDLCWRKFLLSEDLRARGDATNGTCGP